MIYGHPIKVKVSRSDLSQLCGSLMHSNSGGFFVGSNTREGVECSHRQKTKKELLSLTKKNILFTSLEMGLCQ